MPISLKQQDFVNEYCNNGHNATKAYISAGYSNTKAARFNASRLITKDNIKQAISDYKAKQVAKQVNSRELVTTNMFKAAVICLDKGDMNGYIRIMENLGKNCGWFAEDNEQKQESTKLTEQQRKDQDNYNAWKRRQLLKPLQDTG